MLEAVSHAISFAVKVSPNPPVREVEATAIGKDIAFCLAFQVAALAILPSASVPIQVGVNVCTPFNVPIVSPIFVSDEVANACVEDVEPFREVIPELDGVVQIIVPVAESDDTKSPPPHTPPAILSVRVRLVERSPPPESPSPADMVTEEFAGVNPRAVWKYEGECVCHVPNQSPVEVELIVIAPDDVEMVIPVPAVRYAGVYVFEEFPIRSCPEEGVVETPVPPCWGTKIDKA